MNSNKLIGIITSMLGGLGVGAGTAAAISTSEQLWTLLLAALGVALVAAGQFLMRRAGVEPEPVDGREDF